MVTIRERPPLPNASNTPEITTAGLESKKDTLIIRRAGIPISSKAWSAANIERMGPGMARNSSIPTAIMRNTSCRLRAKVSFIRSRRPAP